MNDEIGLPIMVRAMWSVKGIPFWKKVLLTIAAVLIAVGNFFKRKGEE